MCGIVGYINYDEKACKNSILRMTGTLSHRGPDNIDVFVDNNLAFGHARLSIIDVEERANQPFFSDDGNLVLTYNGEIFNYCEIKAKLIAEGIKFYTSSDTEVLLKGYEFYGIRILDYINGFYAFAIYNRRTGNTFVARDRIGIKPLFYYYKDKNLVFASELKAIVEYPKFSKDINQQGMISFLNYQYIPNNQSIYNNTYKLEPGCYLNYSKGEVEIKRYWDLSEKYTGDNGYSLQKNIDIAEALIEDSVKVRLQSDVPIGCFLSGGIDSSLVSFFANKHFNGNIKTFTIGFDYKEFDESAHAKKVADTLKTDHIFEILKAEDSIKLVSQLADIYDEPFADSSALPTLLLSKLAKKSVTVSLSGDGGDELFWGYERYNIVLYIQSKIDFFPRPIAKIIASFLCFLPLSKLQRLLYFVKRYLKSGDLSDLYMWSMQNFIPAELSRLIGEDISSYDVGKIDHIKLFKDKLKNKNDILPLIDIHTYLADDILVKVDRASMFYSLEARVPLLDYRIVEHAINIPFEQKTYNNTPKYILKQILYKHVDKNLFDRPKAGFSVPIKQWLAKDLKHHIDTYLSENYIHKQQLFSWAFINKELTELTKKTNHSPERIWTILMFQLWYERWNLR